MKKVFFEYDDVKATNTRFINGANTYAMAGVTSIKLREKTQHGDVLVLVVIALALMGFVDKEPVAFFPAIGSAVLAFFFIEKRRLSTQSSSRRLGVNLRACCQISLSTPNKW